VPAVTRSEIERVFAGSMGGRWLSGRTPTSSHGTSRSARRGHVNGVSEVGVAARTNWVSCLMRSSASRATLGVMAIHIDSERQTLESTVRAYFDAFNGSNLEELLAVFTPDAVVMADEMPTVIGRDQIRDIYAGAFAGVCFKFKCGIDHVTADGDIGVVRTHATGTMTILAANNTVEAPEHRELFILRRVNGQWLISDYMFNTAATKRS
jgi:uncharacterized protein (TIGR02246 family)